MTGFLILLGLVALADNTGRYVLSSVPAGTHEVVASYLGLDAARSSVVVGAGLALALRSALRVMSPTSENTAIFLLALIAAGAALAAHFGGSAPLAALRRNTLLAGQ